MEREKGFSLIEILVVLGIIGILSSFITPKVMTYMARGKEAKVISTLESLRTASEIYFMEKGKVFKEERGELNKKDINELSEYLSDNISSIANLSKDDSIVKMEIGGSRDSEKGEIFYGGEISFTTKYFGTPDTKSDGIKIWIKPGTDVKTYNLNGDRWIDI